MTKTRDADVDPLSLWEVLEEELIALGGATPPEFAAVKERYRSLRRAVEQARRTAGARSTAGYQRAVEDRDRAEQDYVRFLFDLLHEKRNTALCFSGGGIRSATFGLGVLHGLAHHSAGNGTPGPRLLGEFDYVSTVSGGGFLGSWLSAWRYWHPDGMAGVVRALAATATNKLDPEPEPLRYLRNYTAYLNPRSGLLSADTWTLGATVVRNIILNWTVILPLIAAVLMIPQLALAVMQLIPPSNGPLLTRDQLLLALLAVGFVSIALPTANVARALPGIGGRPATQQQYFSNVLLPMCVGALLLATFWAWHLRSGGSPHSTRQFVMFGVAAHFTGAVVAAIVIFHERPIVRLALAAGALAIAIGAGAFLGFWPAVIVVTALCAVLFRSHLRIVANALAAAIVTGAAGGACAYALGTGPLDPRAMGSGLRLYACLAFPGVLAVFGLVIMFLVAATSKVTSEEDREWWARSGAWLLLVVVGWMAFSAIVLYAPDAFRGLEAAIAAAGGVTGIVAARLGFSGRTASGRREDASARDESAADPPGRLQNLVLKVAAPAALVFLVLLIALGNDWLLGHANVWLPDGVAGRLRAGATGGVTVKLAAAVMLLLLLPAVSLAFLVNINVFSLHGMYRSRLIRAYLGASNPRRRPNPFTGFDPRDNIKMAQLGRRKDAGAASPPIERPLHLVNLALNLVKGDNLAWQQRKAEPFTVTTLHAGSCRVGYQRADRFGDTEGIDIGTAMTISGAAASPNQGYHSSPVVTLLMALFNARLGWWLANPGPHGRGKWNLSGPRWALTPWINEAFGQTTDVSDWVYLSDGGHFENLGLYEMVLRRCRLIVVVDASGDADYALEDLGNAVRKIRVDLGIPVEFPKGLPIRSRFDRANAHCAVGEIQYRCVDGDRTRSGRRIKDGILIYIKPALNGNEPPDVTHYASIAKRFPQQPTSDQWFDEAQFESYRRLGAHSVDEVLGGTGSCTLAQFVRHARRHARAARPA